MTQEYIEKVGAKGDGDYTAEALDSAAKKYGVPRAAL